MRFIVMSNCSRNATISWPFNIRPVGHGRSHPVVAEHKAASTPSKVCEFFSKHAKLLPRFPINFVTLLLYGLLN